MCIHKGSFGEGKRRVKLVQHMRGVRANEEGTKVGLFGHFVDTDGGCPHGKESCMLGGLVMALEGHGCSMEKVIRCGGGCRA